MKSKFAKFINSLGWKKLLLIFVSAIASISGTVVLVLNVSRTTHPISLEEARARERIKNLESKHKSDQEALALDSRFLTFESGMNFLEYAKDKWAPTINTKVSESDSATIMAMLASSSRYFIPFKGKLTGENFGNDDWALLLKGDQNQTSNTQDVYDINTNSAEFDNNSLSNCFDITEEDLNKGSYIFFLNNTSAGLSLKFVDILKDNTGHIGVGKQKDFTRENIENLKEFQKNDSKYYPGKFYDFSFALFQLQLPSSWNR